MLGHLLYLVTFHQILHVLVWATNANMIFPWMSYLFPGNIDGTNVWTKHVYKFDYYPMLMTNIPLLLLWCFHHSIFARVGLKEKIISFASPEVERLFYVASSTAITQFLIHAWRPMPHTVWSLEGPIGLALQALCMFGFVWTALSAITIANNDLFGFREAFTHTPARWVPRHLPLVYRYSRSPLWLGALICVWTAAEMSMGRLLFASAMTLYAVFAARVHDKELLHRYGREYEDYQKNVVLLVPGIRI